MTTEASPDGMATFRQKTEKLALMKEAGLLTDEEFAAQKELLLAEIRGV